MAVSTFVATRGQLAAAYPLWANVSAAWHESLWMTGAVAAAGAAGVACLLFPPRSALDIPTRPKVSERLLLRHGLLLGAWFLLGHVSGLVPIHIAAWRGATAGRLSLSDVAVGVVGVLVLTLVGFSVGALVRTPVVIPIIGLVLFGLMSLPMEPLFRPVGLVLPVRQVSASPRFETSQYTAVYAVLAAIALAWAVVAVVTWARARRSVRNNRSGTAMAVTAALLLVGGAFMWRPELYVVDRPVASVCSDRSGTWICLHEANLPAEADVTRTVAALRRAGLSQALRRVSDAAAVDRDRSRRDEALIHLDPGPFDSSFYASTLEEQVADQVVSEFTVGGCAGRQHVKIRNYDTLRALQQRILELAGFGSLLEGQAPVEATAAKVFAGMTAPQIADFIAENEEAIRGCSLTPSDVLA
ncbi:hypothetical protein DUHN55_41900 [Helicobacter pylori]